MDLTKFLGQDTQEPSAQRLSKEEYAAQKKQEREEIWGMIDGKAVSYTHLPAEPPEKNFSQK